MQQIPVLFLGFANNALAPLLLLEKEADIIYRLLSPANNQHLIQLHREQYATIENIAHYLMEFKNRVSLFHYGGHANSQNLFLRDQAANSDGLAYQLAQQESLKLVFLNGCSTGQQVKLLLELGVPAVIATSVDIKDARAVQFAKNFYKAIASGDTIKVAFEKAAAIVKTEGGEHPQIYRGFGVPHTETNTLPWGLYAREDGVLGETLIPALVPTHTGLKKNVLERVDLEVDDNAHIGNKVPLEGNYAELNVIRDSKIKVKGNFRLGDG